MATGDPAEAPQAGFTLSPTERSVGGIRWRDGHLRIRPSRGAQFVSAFQVAFGLVFAAGAVSTGRWLIAPLSAPYVLLGILHLLCRVDATDGGMRVVNKWRRVRVPIEEVADVVVRPYEPDAGFQPFSDPFHLWRHELEAGMIQRLNAQPVRCDAMVGLAGRGDPVMPRAAAMRVEVLARWLAAERAR